MEKRHFDMVFSREYHVLFFVVVTNYQPSNFKNDQKSILEPGRSLKRPKMQFHGKKFNLFVFTSFFAWTFLNFLARCETQAVWTNHIFIKDMGGKEMLKRSRGFSSSILAKKNQIEIHPTISIVRNHFVWKDTCNFCTE